MEAGRSEVREYSREHSEFKGSLGSLRFCLKKYNIFFLNKIVYNIDAEEKLSKNK